MDLSAIEFGKIIPWVLVWLFGYAIGLLENWLKGKVQKPEVVEAPPKIIEENYALAIFDEEDQLNVKMDGIKLQEQGEMNPQQRKRLLDLIVRLRPWLAGEMTSAPTSPPPASVQTPPQPSAPAPSSSVALTQPVASTETPESEAYHDLNMAGQIDWILQRKLEGHPLKGRGIRLVTEANGGVAFYVDGKKYLYRDEIPSPDVQQIIAEAITEWEKKNAPGL